MSWFANLIEANLDTVPKHCESCHETTDVPMERRICHCGSDKLYLHNRSVGCRCPK